jgi:hypothetical protein
VRQEVEQEKQDSMRLCKIKTRTGTGRRQKGREHKAMEENINKKKNEKCISP